MARFRNGAARAHLIAQWLILAVFLVSVELIEEAFFQNLSAQWGIDRVFLSPFALTIVSGVLAAGALTSYWADDTDAKRPLSLIPFVPPIFMLGAIVGAFYSAGEKVFFRWV